MRAIGLSVGLLCGLAVCLAGQITRPSQVETPKWLPVLSHLASSLSQGDAPGAMESFDKSMKNYGEVEQNIAALTAQSDVLCAIDVVEDTPAADGKRLLDVDWYLQMTSLSDAAATERRRQRVRVELREVRGRWKIVLLEPAGILEPLHAK